MSRIKELRENFGLTQEEFGNKIGMSQQTVSRIENNIESIDVKTLLLITDFFHVSIDYLLGNIDVPWIIKENDSEFQLQNYHHIYQLLTSLTPETLIFIDSVTKQYLNEKEKEDAKNKEALLSSQL